MCVPLAKPPREAVQGCLLRLPTAWAGRPSISGKCPYWEFWDYMLTIVDNLKL
jgi:hypothetical protein